MTAPQLAKGLDVIDILPSAAALDQDRLQRLLARAERQLRSKTPFSIDDRVALFATDPTAELALDPGVVADAIAHIVKRYLVNVEGLASTSHSAGPYSESKTYVGRNDKAGTDVRGELTVTDEDVDKLRPAVTFAGVGVAQVRLPTPRVYVPPGGSYAGVRAGFLPAIVPDVTTFDELGGEVGR